MEAYLAYVMYTAGSYAPAGWSLCQGQLVPVSQNAALYALMGNTFGGSGPNDFALPHLGGRTLVGTGQAPGIGHNYGQGEIGGIEQTTITNNQMPMHVHATPAQPGMVAVTDNTVGDTVSTPEAGARLGAAFDTSTSAAPAIYVPAGGGTTTVNLAGNPAGTTLPAGGSQPLSIMQPYLAMNAVICISGLYPPRP